LPPEIEVVALAEIPAELTLRPTREETPTIYALWESLIWSIQLKLQIPGHPGQIGEAILEEDSPTINKDSIGSYRKALTRRVFDEFSNLDQDFMELLGYAGCDMGHTPFPPARAGEFRRRPLKLSMANHDETPFVP